MHRQQQQQQQQSQQMTQQNQQSQIQQSQTQQRMSRTETRQFTTHQTVQEGHTQMQGQMIDQSGMQQIGFGPNAAPPMFEKVFQNARFAQGGNATFDGRVTGKPQPSVVWTRKGAPLRDSSKNRIAYNEQTGDITLSIYQIGPGDEGEYTCTARNQYGEAVCSVFIQPEGIPMPQGFQKTQTFKSSEHKTVSSAHGTTYQKHQESSEKYYSNGVEQDFKIDTFEYRLLREVSFRESITRRYANETDVHISTSVERSLGPPAPPQITQKPRNSKLLEGSDAVFTAKVGANPRPRLTWFRNGQRIVESNKYESSYSNNQATLRVKQAQAEDSGHYTLLAENPQGCVVSSAYLAIEPVTTQEGLIQESTFKVHQIEEPTDTAKSLAPNFVRVCGDRDVTEGKMTRFDCRVTGRPYPEVTWYINGHQVTDDHNHKILVNESGNHALMITSVARNDSGIVTCVATNKTGETSFQCNLNVIEKEQVVAPKFVERFTTTNVRDGEPVVLHARAVGTPAPRITWQKDGVPLTSSHEIRITTDNSGSSTLDIPRAKASDAAWYQCTAQNVAGSTATRARLFVEVPQGPTSEPWRLHLPRPTKVIEPEPEPGPEVIYLKHIEPTQPYYPRAEEDRVYPPPQFIIPLRDVMQIEGGKVHFEARIEPVGDPTMRVEWFVNEKSLEASSRATTIFRFGFIALDLLTITLRDSGEYLCRVTSATGTAESRATLGVTARASIERTSQHPDSLQYIQQLEDYSKYQRSESLEETSSQKPHFIRPLQDLGALQEGRNAHFEAQLTPVSDPTMKVEWYKDGKPITASSRISTIFNFGYVSLNIMHLRAEDAGTYTVRAVNRIGEAISSAHIQVIVRSTVTADLGIPEQQRYIDKVGELEAYQQQQHHKYVQETPESLYPPEFKTPIKDQHGIRESGFAHFEARLEPTGDSTLKVEWLKDGRPVEASSRITTFFNFGYVALTIKAVTIHDVGNYTCRAYNAMGEAVTTAQLSVVSKKDIIVDSQHPGGLQKIQHLEDTSKFSRKVDEETTVKQKPRFLGPLKGTNKIVEGQRAHFEARVEPQNDSTMKLDWYFNGKLIQSANRIQTYHDFGYVALDILSVRGDDTGTYTVVARNPLGEAQLSASMVVETRASIDTRSMHRNAYEKTQRMEKPPHVEPEYHIEELCKSKPIFVVPLSDPQPVSEGRNIHVECRLEPMGDPTMRVDWFCNGKPITVGSRFRTYNDFGFVALDIIHATALDSGEYTVRATNQLGSAHTSACVRVISRSDIVTDTQHEQSLEQIQMLENRTHRQAVEDVTVMQAPQFTRPLHNIETIEGTNVHMECRLQPVGDSSMKVAWFVNGRPMKTGHRFRPAYDFDYVALDLLSVYPEDSGVYTCQAVNQLGEAVTSCSVKVLAKKDLLLESQHPGGLEKIQYLEDSSRYKRTEHVDEVISVKPRFVTKPKSMDNMREGQHAHFECKLEPVTDSNLKVEWYKNGRPITIGHRFRPIHDFGYVALDVIDLIAEDSGTYTCRAVNLVGVDEVTCSLTCGSSRPIITETQHEQGLSKIHHLEDRVRYHRAEVVDEVTTQAPIFTTSLKNIEIREGQRAHFECRLIPVSDSTMKVEWFHNNKPLKSGSRFTETNNFGFVALDILYTYPEDSGTYTCRATNANGDAVTSSVCVVHSKKAIYSETVNENALERIHELEDHSRYHRQTAQEEYVSQAPVFTMPIKDLHVAENQAAHFEARLIPVGDSRLKVEWLRNGVPIQASNRLTTMHDFGYVALNMKYVNPEDSGTYTCRAVNDLGEAVTSATLAVQSKSSLQLETQHEAALQKLRQLEDTSKYQRREEEEVTVTEAPRFTTQLNGPTELVESQSAHYECRIEPYPDTSLKVEWLHNGKPLTTGHRFRTAYDFGFASLDVLTVYGEDAGEYTCRATNRIGQAQSSIVTKVTTKANIVRDTQHEGALQKIQYLEDDSRYKKVATEDALTLEKPQFGKSLKNVENLPEGLSAHLEATLTPVNDPTMKVEWFCNGRPIQTGHRFKTTYDFGFVALDILYAYAEDSGTYMCRARNAVGEAITTASVNVVAKSGLHLETLDEQRLKKIRELENYERPQKQEVEAAPQRPVFLTPLTSLENLKEGEHAHLECRVEPINDANLKIEWFVNGVKLKTGHRFRTTHDFGYVALDILYAYPEDSGTYMCKATNLVGEAVNTCTIKVGGHRSIILDTHHPEGLQKIRELEAQGRPTRLEIEEPEPTPPRFVTELRGTTHVYEGQTAHFEAQVEPIHDPNLRIEFYHNDKPLPSASRFHITFDFGYIALDITHCVSEDAGQYSVKAINNLGECKSSISLKVTAQGNIILDSQRPEGLEKIRQLEEHTPYKRPEIEEPQTRQRPVFTQPLQNIDHLIEGQTAHFECRLIPVGDPTLKVEWFRNEKPIEDSSRITKVHDFGFVSLDITHVRDEDQGVYMCRASNPLGEAVTTASMKIKTKANIQLETQHEESMRRIQQLEQPLAPRQDEPDRVFDKPVFTQLLTGPTELWEGQHAHFEARVVPVGDSNLRFEWYVNGVELKLGSRFRVNHDFGFVTLDIMSTVPEDSGVYTCKAINKSGEAVSSISMKVKSRSHIMRDALQPDAWQKIQLKEAEMNKVPEKFVDSTPQEAPVFTTHLLSYDNLAEGQHVYLEAQVEPRADPNLRIEWYKNGVSLTTGTRLKSTFDFGHVTMSINGLRGDDSAIYTCKATNLLGEAVSTCTLKVQDKHWLLGQSLHPDAIPKLEALERPPESGTFTVEPTYDAPIFISHLNNVECVEGDSAHFQCQVEPSKDPTMKIEWFINGKPLPSGSRYKSTYDFGFISLDVSHTYEEDSGIYTCKATNSKGTASTSGSLRCTGKQNIYLDTQHPQGKTGFEKVQEVDDELANRYQRQASGPDSQFSKPIWTIPLNPEFKLIEGQALHLEGTVIPKDDPNLKIEWFVNGKSLDHGSRFKLSNDFGFVTLDLTGIYERDQGIYTCKASNKAGEAFTSSTIYCSSKSNLIERTQHPKGKEGLERIQDLEDSLSRGEAPKIESEEGHAPVFTSNFTNLVNLSEGEIAHFEAGLTPIGDQTMVVEWFYNGKTIAASHRLRTVHAFGMVVLEVLGTKIEDSGTYTCRATNKWGTAEQNVNLQCVDKYSGQKPRFTTQIKDIVGLKDGQSAHFECTVVPTNDPNLKIEWFHNDQPILQSSRIKTVSDFGFVVMDISYIQNHDSGKYVCKASNKFGEDYTRASITAYGRSGVFSESLQPDSLAKIRELESSQIQQQQAPTTPVAEPPKFITQIADIARLVEGQSAHFEARLTPVTDPDLVVEWYYNGKKLPHGHRYRTFHDFGIVILDILYCYEENSGTYECRAYNKYGEDSTKAKMTCISKVNLILDSQLPRGMEGGLEKIQTLEDSHVRHKDETVIEEKGKAPVFTVPLSNIDSLREGENAHFEGRLIPTDDPKLKVEWFWNGKPLRTGSRFRTFHDFGFVILEISPVYPEDSGEYSCRASNDYGQAVTTSTMKVQGKRSIILESQLPKGMEGTIDRIAELEGLGSAPTPMSPEEDSGKPPEFITTPADLTLSENNLAHFECRLTPVNDPSMRVEWYHNGKALWAGSRIKTINDFGFVILEIAGIYQRDSGLYTCKATNRHGEATVSCTLQVRGRQGIVLEPQLPTNFRTGTESIQKLEEILHKKDEIISEEETPNPPRFIVEIKDNVDIPEGGPIHFDCRVEPANDATMRIDWFHNGRPFATGSRVHQVNDFGFIALDMDYVYARDAGEYVCRATNKWGSCTTKAIVTCTTKQNIDTETQLPSGLSAEKLKELEKGGPVFVPPKEDAPMGPPKFITHIESVTVEESETIRFECRVEPKEDPKLRIEWYRNGKPLPMGHRYRNVYDMGFVSLDILYVYAEDSGEYVCRAVNDYGEDFTRANISCKQLPNIILQNQVPKGMKKSETLMQMEAAIKKYTSEIHLTEEDLFDADKKQPPRFVTQIKDQTDLVEMETTKFECQLAPVGDPNMKVEWFLNGKPLPYKNRFTPIYDFGYVAMNFGWVYPEDSGEYLCRATNLYGMDETRAIIRTAGKPGIIYESQLPKGMKSIERIRELESAWQVVPEEREEEEKPRTAPIFVSNPEACTVEEGGWARFCCRVTGHPRPRVMWLINGNTVVNGSRYKLTYDGMYHMDIPKTRQYDTGKVEVIARSSVGEAVAETELKVVPRHDDWRSVLKNAPRPWYDIESTDFQRDDTELEKVFDERNASFQESGRQHTVHIQPKQYKEPDTEWQQNVKQKKNEDYYSKLQNVENEQVTKEVKLRESSHQFAIPGEKVKQGSMAKGMAQKYQDNLNQEPEERELAPIPTLPKGQVPHAQQVQLRKTEKGKQLLQETDVEIDSKKGAYPPEPTESGVHGREVHVSKQKQTQKEKRGDQEITRHITATETTDVEHKGKTQERVVQGQVLPSTPPVFTKKIQPCRAVENDQARFEVEFDGDPLPTVKWFRQDFPITSSPDFKIYTFSTKSILVMRQVFIEDSGLFSVVAENRGGTAKCSANLIVEERRVQARGGVIPPSFVNTVQNAKATSGQLVRFDARINGTKPLDVYWLKGGKKITPDIRYKVLEEDGVHTLLIIEVVPEDSGKYECVAMNSAGEARCEAECAVHSPSTPARPSKPTTPGAEKAPSVIEPLKDQSIREGQVVAFKCKISAKPSPQVKWQKGDKIIKPSKYFQMVNEGDLHTLKISEAFPEDEGVYKCVATNPAGTITLQANLRVLAPDSQDVLPSLTPLKDVIVPEGSPAQFKTTVSGKPKPTIQWLREGFLIPESPDFQMIHEGNNAILLISNTYEEDTGTFTVRATTSAGQVERSAKLIVKKKEETGVAPCFKQPLKPQIVEEDKSAILECLVFGTPTPTVKWYRNNDEIKEDETYVTKYDTKTGFATLEILKPTQEDETIYTVRADNKFGKAQCRANLIISKDVAITKPIVMQAPKITKPIKALVVRPEEDIVLNVEFEGTPLPEISWLKNGQKITSTEDMKVDTTSNKTKLTISKKVSKKAGKYEVQAVNVKGEARTSGSVTVTDNKEMLDALAPTFIRPIKSQVITLGETVIMEAEVEAQPMASFQWYQGSTPLVSSTEVRVTTFGNRSVLQIGEVNTKIMEPITCQAENAIGSVTCTAAIEVVDDNEWEETREFEYPRFVKKLSPLTVMDGENVTLTCQVTGKPTPRVQWFLNGNPVQQAKDVTISQDSEGICMLSISEVFPENAGEYTCEAINKIGEAICKTSLIVDSYEYIADSEIGLMTGPSGSEDDLLDKTLSDLEMFSDSDVECAPKIIKKLPEVVTTKDGDVTKLEVKAVGKPTPTGRWLKQGEEIVPSEEFTIENFEDGTSVLIISEVYPDDTGEIVYEAHNPLGVAVTTTELTVESIMGTKEYRKPEWVTHMEELQVALQAARSAPTFVKEIKDVRTTELETIVFECMFSGTPTPDIVWYFNNKIIRNTDKIKIRIQDNTTTCTIKDVSVENVGVYQCKAVSDAGNTTTKAKLYVQEIPQQKKKELQIKKAIEEEERIKKERVKVDKKVIRKQRVTTTTEEVIKPLGVEEVQTIEVTEEISKFIDEKVKAEEIISPHEPISTEAIASCKKIDDEETEPLEILQQQAEKKLSPQEPLSVSDVIPEGFVEEMRDGVPELGRASVRTRSLYQEATVTEVKLEDIIERVEKIIVQEELKMAKEVTEVLDLIKAKEFGPGESPLRELAEIGYLMKTGITVNEITLLYNENKFPSLKTPDSQSALVNVVERKGYSPLISQVLTEETTSDEGKLAATVGFKAFMKMIEYKYATVEEVLTQFSPEDFIQRVWETAEVTEDIIKTKAVETVTVTEKSEVHIDSREETKITVTEDTAQEFSVDKPEPPMFTERFQGLTVTEKSTIRLFARVIGNPVPTVTWLRNNEPFKPDSRTKISYDGENIELLISNANSEIDSGDYKCIASNTVGKASHGAKVFVDVETVKFTKKLKKTVEVLEHDTLTLECETSHIVSTKWFHNGKEVTGMDHHVPTEDGRTHKLVIKKTTLNDTGTYKCTVKNQKTESNVTVIERKPEFIRKLNDYEVKEKDTAILEVEITSDAAEVVWKKDGQPIDENDERFTIEKEDGVRKLIIRGISIHDEGEYSCALPNDQCNGDLTVVELPPEIITKMVDQTVIKGEKATFEIELTKGDALVRWFKDDTEIQFSEHIQLSIDGKRQKLKIYNTEMDDKGTYSCQVGQQKSSAKLTVKKPPLRFVKELPEYTITRINIDVTLTVELNRSDAEVEWLRRGRIIEESTKYTLLSDNCIKKMVIHNVKREDEVEYSCRVEDLNTTTTLKVEIVETPPKLFLDDEHKVYKVRKGENVTFNIKYTATPTPTTEWTVNHTLVLPSRRHQPTIDEENVSLTIRRVEPDDMGKYVIKLRNNCGEASASLTLLVIDVPTKPGTPELVDVTDTSITLLWKAPESDGNTPITNYIIEYREKDSIKWLRTTETITSTNYTITTVQKHKEYSFRIIAVNEIGDSEPSNSSEYLLISTPTAKEAPTIIETLKDTKIGLRKKLVLTCVITGHPLPDITWFKDGKVVKSKSITYESHVAKYVIEETTETTEGIYTVKAQNIMGTAETRCQVMVQEVPQLEVDETLVDQMLKVNEQWKVAFKVSGYPHPDITWKKDGIVITATNKHAYYFSDETSTTIVIYSIDRTDTGTYTVIAENSAGFAEKDLKLRVVDKPTPPEGPMSIANIEKTSVTISWHPPLDDGGMDLTKYLIEKYEISSMKWTKVADVETTVTSYTVQELQTSADYIFRVYAQNPIGKSEPLESEKMSLKSSFKVPSPPRAPLEISGMSATSFTINWQASASDGGSSIIEYIVEMKEANRRVFKKLGATKGAVTSFAVNYLEKNQGYNFKITARNSAGLSEPFLPDDTITAGSRIRIKYEFAKTDSTLYCLLGIFPPTKLGTPTTPSAPRKLRVTDTTTKSATIVWEPPESTGGSEITGYIIEKKLEYMPTWEKVATVEEFVREYTFGNLKEKTKYVFRVFAENCVGLSTPATTSTVHLLTHATVPSPPTAPLEIRTIGPNAIVIEWGIPEFDGGAPLLGYNVAIRDTKKTMWMEVGRVTVPTQKFTIRDLQEDHEYLIRVFARNEVGISEPLESDEPFKVLPSTDADAEEFKEVTDREPTSYSTETTTSWLRDNSMDADIYTYSKGKLLQKNEYFFKIWCFADELFK